MKVLTVVGARPQFVKAAAVSRAFLANNTIQEIIVHTGQHYDPNMSDIFFTEMEIPQPHYNLNISGSSHGAMTGRMIEGLEEIMLKEKPDLILVYGDTNSTLAGSIAASKIHIPVAHVESGLRSYNMRMPEEVNRIVTDRLSSFLFCPTRQSITNLQQEAFDQFNTKIIFSGDVMFDAALYYEAKSDEHTAILDSLQLTSGSFVLATIHRAENTDVPGRLQEIFAAFQELATGIDVVLPLHPRTRKLLEVHQIQISGVKIIDPVGYMDMLQLVKNCKIVVTDSGGLQKEAYFFKKGCITTRDETEWVELVENGYNILTGADKKRILDAYAVMQSRSISHEHNLYGQGDASGVIRDELLKAFH